MFDLISIGDCTLDAFIVIDDSSKDCHLDLQKNQLCVDYAEKIPIQEVDQSVGGNAANVAVGARMLGLKTAIVTELGDDVSGDVIAHELKDRGVDPRFIRHHKGKESRFSVVLTYKAERTILSYHAPRSYHLPILPKTSWIYFTSLGKGFEKLQSKILALKKKHSDLHLAVNPGSYQMTDGLAIFKQVLPFTDVLFINKEEAVKLIGKKKNIKHTIKALHQTGVQTVIITDSSSGSFASDGGSIFFLPSYPVRPIAKTGAGDAYASGFLSAMHHGKSLEEAMQWGTANASGVIQKIGSLEGLYTRKQILKTIKKYRKVTVSVL